MPSTTPMHSLLEEGQSLWLDQLRREWTQDGTLRSFIADDAVRGVTSNPSIFQEALGNSDAYDDQIRELVGDGLDAEGIYDRLTLTDIRAACDIFLPLYEATEGHDGYVSHEVTPALAYDTRGTIREVKRLWEAVDRPNVIIKIPATNEGIPAIRHCLREGINVNITLMFSLCHYDAVVEAYLSALEDRLESGEPLERLASVASFFVSRVDSLVDERLDRLADDGRDAARKLRGKVAVANAQLAWARAREVFEGTRFGRLARHDASLQRVLWASTSTKDPDYSDVKYVEELIGPDTVNTVPLETLDAFRDHGTVRRTVDGDLVEARAVIDRLNDLGIDLNQVGQELSRRGVEKFQASLDSVMDTVRDKVSQVGQPA